MTIRNTIAAAALGLALASTSQADTIYVAGSTAFRTAFHDAVFSLMTAGGNKCNVCYATPGTEGMRDASKTVFSGKINGVDTVIKCAWSGSVGGISGLTAPASVNNTFLPGATLTEVTRTGIYPAYSYTGATASAETAAAHAADLGMSDVFQNSTTFTTPVLDYDRRVAVIPFLFVASDNSETAGVNHVGFDNITPLQAQLLWGAGRVSLSLFTGDKADNKPTPPAAANPGKEVFAFGRNNDSGTRLTMLAEMGKGATANVLQYSYTPGTNLFSATASNAGTSAVNQATWLSDDDFGPTVGYAIGMLGVADAAPAIASGAQALKWNGVPYTADNVRYGKYTVWGYEHLFVRNGAAATVTDIADALATEMTENPGEAGIKLDTMNVQRGSEGGLIDLND
ncbi:hypothetical protein [Haloferula sp. BvORR071]|uniref:hypothetical protein n=1 Tax=Haloferula sp. BvORR071 TaxID=1396141 RepID=UPI00054E5C77|nr:hypothetical protein [Haloferula sp. BvORR071]